jgi:hypothetical protein
MSSAKLNSVSSDPEIVDYDGKSESELKYQSIGRQDHLYENQYFGSYHRSNRFDSEIPDVRVPMDELLSEEYVTRLDQDLEFVENIMKELLKCKQRIDECTFLESRRPKIYPDPPSPFPNIFPI